MNSPPEHQEYPDTDEGWRARYLAEAAGKGKWRKYPDPFTMLRVSDVAALINVKPDTIYQYRRYGNVPVPDLQEGGRKPKPGELITWTGRKALRTMADGTTRLHPVATQRKPRVGELIAPHQVGWHAWRIYRWITAERPGRGWHATGKDRKPYAARRKIGPGGWVPPKVEATTEQT